MHPLQLSPQYDRSFFQKLIQFAGTFLQLIHVILGLDEFAAKVADLPFKTCVPHSFTSGKIWLIFCFILRPGTLTSYQENGVNASPAMAFFGARLQYFEHVCDIVRGAGECQNACTLANTYGG